MEYKFGDVVQRAIVCMNTRILNAPIEEDRPDWYGFSSRWFNRIHASKESVVGNNGTIEVVRRVVSFLHVGAGVARVTLEGIYPLDENGKRSSQFALWDVSQFSYARRFNANRQAKDWKVVHCIAHNGATLSVTS